MMEDHGFFLTLITCCLFGYSPVAAGPLQVESKADTGWLGPYAPAKENSWQYREMR